MSQMSELKSAINGLTIQMKEMSDRLHDSQIVINSSETAISIFKGIARESAKEVMSEVLAQQQNQINELASGLISITGAVQSILNASLQVVSEEVVSKKVVQTFKVDKQNKKDDLNNEIKDEKSKSDEMFWVHVPTRPNGSINWKKGGMTAEEVAYQVIYELERVRGVDVSKPCNIDQSLYVGIKSRIKGITWSDIVEQARRKAIKL